MSYNFYLKVFIEDTGQLLSKEIFNINILYAIKLHLNPMVLKSKFQAF